MAAQFFKFMAETHDQAHIPDSQRGSFESWAMFAHFSDLTDKSHRRYEILRDVVREARDIYDAVLGPVPKKKKVG